MVQESDFIRFAAGVMGVSAEKLTLDTAYGSIPEWDSVMHLRLVMEMEAAYGVSLPIAVIPELKTLGDFHRWLADANSPVSLPQGAAAVRARDI